MGTSQFSLTPAAGHSASRVFARNWLAQRGPQLWKFANDNQRTHK